MGGAKLELGLLGVQAGAGASRQGFGIAKEVAPTILTKLSATGEVFGAANVEASRLAVQTVCGIAQCGVGAGKREVFRMIGAASAKWSAQAVTSMVGDAGIEPATPAV